MRVARKTVWFFVVLAACLLQLPQVEISFAETADSYLANKRAADAAKRFKPVTHLKVKCSNSCVNHRYYVCSRRSRWSSCTCQFSFRRC